MKAQTYHYEDFDMDSIFAVHKYTDGLVMNLRHLHSQYEILFIKDGTVHVESNASFFTVSTPSLIIHKPFYLHRANAPRDRLYERYVINISGDLLAKVEHLIPNFSFLSAAETAVIPLDDDMIETVTDCMERVIDSHARGSLSETLLEIALLLVRATDYAVQKKIPLPPENGYIADVIRYITKHYADDIKIDFLADTFFVSRSKLIADFKASIGVTVKKYIMFVKISNAESFLYAGKSITETASLCGFYDNSHFIAAFKLLTGMTPKEFTRKKEM